MSPYYDHRGVTIYHGDALDVLPELEAGSVGAVVTDPPYSSGGMYRGDRAMRAIQKYVQSDSSGRLTLADFGGDTRDQRGFLAWSSLWLAAAWHTATAGAVACVFTDWRQLPTLTDALQAGGWVWRNLATWHKPGVRMQRGMFSGSAEYIVFGTKGERLEHDGAPQNVFACPPIRTASKRHIAEKPEEVMGWILSVVRPGSVVLDPFMGSGSTLRAAKDRGLRAIGIDSNEACCEAAARRLEQEVFIFGGEQ